MQLSKKFKIIDARSDPPKNQGNRGERLQNHGIHGYYTVACAHKVLIEVPEPKRDKMLLSCANSPSGS